MRLFGFSRDHQIDSDDHADAMPRIEALEDRLLFSSTITFDRPALPVTIEELQAIDVAIDAQDPDVYASFLALQDGSYPGINNGTHLSTYTFTPVTDLWINGGPGPYPQPDVGKNAFTSSGEAAYIQSLLWYFTGNENYAETAVEVLDGWGSTLESIGGFNAPLSAGPFIERMSFAADLLRHEWSGWGAAEDAILDTFIDTTYDVILPELSPTPTVLGGKNGNWHTLTNAGVMAFATLAEDEHLFLAALDNTQDYLDKYVLPHGQTSETYRDISPHTNMQIKGHLAALQNAYVQGYDLWTPNQSKILNMLEMHAGLINAGSGLASVHGIDINNDSVVDSNDDVVDVWFSKSNYFLGYYHMNQVMGLSLPETGALVNSISLEGHDGAHGIGDLLYVDKGSVFGGGDKTLPTLDAADPIAAWEFDNASGQLFAPDSSTVTAVVDATEWTPSDMGYGSDAIKFKNSANNGSSVYVEVDMTGLEDLLVSYTQKGQNSPFQQEWAYSADGGTTFTVFATYSSSSTNTRQLVDLRDIVVLDDNPNVVLRLRLDGAGQSTSSVSLLDLRLDARPPRVIPSSGVSLTFDAAAEVTDNFTVLDSNGRSTLGHNTVDQTMRITQTNNNSRSSMLFNDGSTAGIDTYGAVTLEFDITPSYNNRLETGVWFNLDENRDNGLFVRFEVNKGSTADRIVFYDSSVATASPDDDTAFGTQVFELATSTDLTTNGATLRVALDVQHVGGQVQTTATLYDAALAGAVLGSQANPFTASYTFASTPRSGELGLFHRTNQLGSGHYIDIDNFTLDGAATSTPPATGPQVDFTGRSFSGYGGQDAAGSGAAVEGGGASLRLTGNAWKKTAYDYDVTPETVIAFELSASDTGEILGIGLDSDDNFSNTNGVSLYLGGSQSIPSQFTGIGESDYLTSEGTRSYVIPIGQYFTGSVNWLTFTADDDANASANALFSNVKLYDEVQADFTGASFSGYTGGDDAGSTATVENAGDSVRLAGNAWKKTAFSYDVQLNTYLAFDVNASDAGEVLGIGLDADNDFGNSDGINFYLGGSQGIPSQLTSTGESDYLTSEGTRSYVIPIGQFFTGSVNWLTLIADDDADASSNALFSNVRLYEA